MFFPPYPFLPKRGGGQHQGGPTLPVFGLIGNGDDGCGTSAGRLVVAEICRGRWHRDCLVAQLVSVHWTEEAYDVR